VSGANFETAFSQAFRISSVNSDQSIELLLHDFGCFCRTLHGVHVDVLSHRRVFVAEVIGNFRGGESCLVEDRSHPPLSWLSLSAVEPLPD